MSSPDPPFEIHENAPHPLEPWFDVFRGERDGFRERAASGPVRTRAVLTMVRDEALFLPIWLRYYGRFFPPEDIYVIDHDSRDGSTSTGGFNRIPVHNPEFDDVWRKQAVEEQHRLLLERYDTVLFVDVDEFVIPRDPAQTLDQYMDRFDEPWVNALGYEVVHLPDREPPLDPDRPILGQRGYWFASAAYNKVVLATEPISWTPGFHRREDSAFRVEPDLLLVHLHRVDYERCLARHLEWTRRKWSERQVESGWGSHYAISEAADFDRWYFTDSAIENQPPLVEEIPRGLRDAF